MEICIDFDGTCVTHEYPEIGQDIGAIPVLRKLVKAGHRLILFTMRSNVFKDKPYLDNAVEWFKNNNIPLYGINKNPTQSSWSSSPKAYGHLYIDDCALGIPLCYSSNVRPYVDWVLVEDLLKNMGLILD